MFEPMELTNDMVIKVIGVGDGDGNTVEHMAREHIESVEFFVVNTGAQALCKTAVEQTIRVDSDITKGLGIGVNPEVGRNAADESRDALHVALEGVDMVFVTAGVSGGTGIDTAPIVTEVAKDLGILTAAVVTRPFNSESGKRMVFTEQGTTELSRRVDSLITIPSDKLLKVLGRGISLLGAFGVTDDILKSAVQDITELITHSGLTNVDFADVHTVVSKIGYAMMSSGVANGEDRTEEVAEMAISSPLLEDTGLSGMHGVLVSITAGFDLCLDEFEVVGNTICTFASDDVTVVVGTSPDPDINDELHVTVVVVDIGMDKRPKIILVTNKQIRQPVVGRYQQRGMTLLTREQKPVAKVVNDNTSQTAKEPDYLGIPALLRRQTD